jgi:hypothetical protein
MAKQSAIPVFKRLGDFKMELGNRERIVHEVQCGYQDCRHVFIVAKRYWSSLNKLDKEQGRMRVYTRPCPYCFRVNYLDEDVKAELGERFQNASRERRGEQ